MYQGSISMVVTTIFLSMQIMSCPNLNNANHSNSKQCSIIPLKPHFIFSLLKLSMILIHKFLWTNMCVYTRERERGSLAGTEMWVVVRGGGAHSLFMRWVGRVQNGHGTDRNFITEMFTLLCLSRLLLFDWPRKQNWLIDHQGFYLFTALTGHWNCGETQCIGVSWRWWGRGKPHDIPLEELYLWKVTQM